MLRIEQTGKNGGWQTGAVRFVKYLNSNKPEILLGYEYENDVECRGPAWPPDAPKNYIVHWEHIAEDSSYKAIYGWEYKSPVAPLFLHRIQVKAFKRMTPFNLKPNGPQNNGGIHVNVECNEATAPYYKRVFEFMHRTAPNESLIKLSGRSVQNYNTFCKQHNHAWSWNTYYGVITSRKSYAYELRLFAAHPDLLIPSLEFSDALFRLARIEEQITMDKMRNFLNQPQYKAIAAHWDTALAA